MTAQVLRSLYEYESSDSKILSFVADDRFLVIKGGKGSDWVYAVNAYGKLGYVPHNYVITDDVEDSSLLALIDSIANQLDAKHNDSNAITDRQVKHAQIKLAQLRCEVVQRIFKKNSSQDIITETETNSDDCDVTNDQNNRQNDKTNNLNDSNDQILLNGSHTGTNNGIEVNNKRSNNYKPDTSHSDSTVKIPDVLIPELIERVRVSTDLNHGMCILAVKTVIECLSERIPEWSSSCESIIQSLCSVNDCPNTNVQSSDLIKLKSVFKKLWWCKNDEQQRSWPVHQDEHIITSYLEELLQILSNANPIVIKDAIFKDNYENVHMLVTYFQMETRRSLRMKLYSIFLCLISLFENIISDYLLISVLPAELAAEMLTYVTDEERWCSAALLFTAVFSTGHKPPINIYEHINEKFIVDQLDLIERIDSNGHRIETNISPESSIAPILAFNLHFNDSNNNIVLNALKKRRNASQLTENLVSYLNWEEDITKVCGSIKDTNYDTSSSNTVPNSALKLLIEMFGNTEVAKLFYYNDVRVVIDILIRQLNNLSAGDYTRSSYLTLLRYVIANTPYNEEPHKIDELSKCLKSIVNHECSTDAELALVESIKRDHPILFNCL